MIAAGRDLGVRSLVLASVSSFASLSVSIRASEPTRPSSLPGPIQRSSRGGLKTVVGLSDPRLVAIMPRMRRMEAG